MSTCNTIIRFARDLSMIMSTGNKIMLHVDIIYISCRGQKNATTFPNVWLLWIKTNKEIYVGILLSCMIKYTNMQHNHDNMRLMNVSVQDNNVYLQLININVLHVDMIYLVFRRQMYVTIVKQLKTRNLYCSTLNTNLTFLVIH